MATEPSPFLLDEARTRTTLRSTPDSLVTFLVRPAQRQFVLNRYQGFRDELMSQVESGNVSPQAIEYLLTFPDWISRVGGDLVNSPELIEAAKLNPAIAYQFLKINYDAHHEVFEPVVLESGEYTRELLELAGRHKVKLALGEKAYRDALIKDCYHGMVFARQGNNISLSSEIETWALKNKDKEPGAAWFYLTITPDEPAFHYTRLLRSSPLYYWLCCLQMPGRIKASEADALSVVNGDPRWAAHFAWADVYPQAMEKVMSKNYGWFAQYMIVSGRAWNTSQWHSLVYEPVVKANKALGSESSEVMWFIGLEVAKITIRLYRMFDVLGSTEEAAPER